MARLLGTISVLAFICGTPSTVFAQAIPDWTLGIRLGKPLFVTMLNGERIEGVAGSVTEEGVGVATPIGVRTAKFAEIRRVERRDSVWNGVAFGAAVGLAAGVVAILNEDGCPPNSSSCNSELAAVPMGGALYGALIGWGIDAALKGRTTVFDGPGAPHVSLGAGAKGIIARVTVSW